VILRFDFWGLFLTEDEGCHDVDSFLKDRKGRVDGIEALMDAKMEHEVGMTNTVDHMRDQEGSLNKLLKIRKQ
jgi:hypothetical protein